MKSAHRIQSFLLRSQLRLGALVPALDLFRDGVDLEKVVQYNEYHGRNAEKDGQSIQITVGDHDGGCLEGENCKTLG